MSSLTDGSLWGKMKKKSLEALGKNPDDPNATEELKEQAKQGLHKAARGAFKVSAGAYAMQKQAKNYWKGKKKALEDKLIAEGEKAIEESGTKAKAMGFYEQAKNNEKTKKMMGKTQGWVDKAKSSMATKKPVQNS